MKKTISKIIKFLYGVVPFSISAVIYRSLVKLPLIKNIISGFFKSIIPEKIVLPEGTLFLNKNDAVVSGAVTLEIYETFEVTLFKEKIKPGMSVLDIGANIGLFTLSAATAVGENGSVFGFEPDPQNFYFLSKTISYNNFSRVKLFEKAVGDFNGKINLFISKENRGDHRIYPVEKDNRKIISVDITTIDTMVKDRIIPDKVDIVKVDVQGVEKQVLTGMAELIKNSVNLKIFLEFWPYGLKKVKTEPLTFLCDLEKDFNLFEICEKKQKVVKINDLHKFVKMLSWKKYANLLCEKIIR